MVKDLFPRLGPGSLRPPKRCWPQPRSWPSRWLSRCDTVGTVLGIGHGTFFDYLGLSENRVYSQWNSHLIGIVISKTIGFRGTPFSDKPIFRDCMGIKKVFLMVILRECYWMCPVECCVSHTDIQILIVMIVNADSTCDQCALDALQHFRKTGFIMKHMYEINVQYQSLQKLGPQKTLANENNWQRWIRCITCSIKRSAHPNKCLTNNMARQREQSQDKPAWEPLNTTWPTEQFVLCLWHV